MVRAGVSRPAEQDLLGAGGPLSQPSDPFYRDLDHFTSTTTPDEGEETNSIMIDEGMNSIDDLQIQLSEEVRSTGKAWFATTQHRGEVWLRFNMVNLHTREHDLDELIVLLEEAMSRLGGKEPQRSQRT